MRTSYESFSEITRGASPGRVSYQSTPSALWSLSALCAVCVGAGAVSLVGLMAWAFGWSILVVLGLGGLAVLGGFCWGGLRLVDDERELLRRMVEGPEQPARVVESRTRPPVIVYGRKPPALPPSLAEEWPLLSRAEMQEARRSMVLSTFLRISYRTQDPTWETWRRMLLPDGSTMSEAEWSECCELMLRAGVAMRPYPRAPIRYCCELPEIRARLREVLAPALPAPED